jgi:hypothetical protein
MKSEIQIASLPIPLNRLAMPSNARSAVGIDLGTTNSVASLGTWDPSHPEVLQIRCIEVEQPTAELGDHIATLVPSIVSLAGGKTYVGEGAKRLAASGASRGLRRNREFFSETKNEMGTDRGYPQAPERYRTPGEIGGHVLRFLMGSAPADPSAVVVTVPASFQVAQRHETVAAAAHAGFDLLKTQLLDEPLAAFIDFLATQPSRLSIAPGTSCNLLVFDFGGGKALLAKDAKDDAQKQASLLAATGTWPTPRRMQDWMLYWYTIWAQESGDDASLSAAEQERDRRRREQPTTDEDPGVLPASSGPNR